MKKKLLGVVFLHSPRIHYTYSTIFSIWTIFQYHLINFIGERQQYLWQNNFFSSNVFIRISWTNENLILFRWKFYCQASQISGKLLLNMNRWTKISFFTSHHWIDVCIFDFRYNNKYRNSYNCGRQNVCRELWTISIEWELSVLPYIIHEWN